MGSTVFLVRSSSLVNVESFREAGGWDTMIPFYMDTGSLGFWKRIFVAFAEGNLARFSTLPAVHDLKRGSCINLVKLAPLITVPSYSPFRIAVDLAWKFHVGDRAVQEVIQR
jgi:hypothetical protein